MKIIIPVKLFQKLKAYVKATPYEISGFGKLKQVNGVFYVTDLRIFNQVVSSGHTRLDRDSLGDFMYELMEQGEDIGEWKLWWHSHGLLDVFFSSTDLATIEDFDNDTRDENWILSLVTNHKGDIKTRIDIFYPMRCTIEDLDIDMTFDDKSVQGSAIDEVMEKVKFLQPKAPPPSVRWPYPPMGSTILPDGSTIPPVLGNGPHNWSLGKDGILLPPDDTSE